MNGRHNPDLFEDYQDATEHQQELDERAEYEEAMQGKEEWELKTLYRKYTGHGLKITNEMRERAK